MMRKFSYNFCFAKRFFLRNLLVVFFLILIQFCYAQTKSNTSVILPGAKVYDVTNPKTYGGTIVATPNNPLDDDALAINQAIAAAAKFVSNNSKNDSEVFQQIILIPKGDYHLASSIVLPRTEKSRENAIWIFGEGSESTKFILKTAKEIGRFGTSTKPKALVQYTPYSHGKEAAGNTNFQLWGSDYAVTIPDDQLYTVGISYGCANMGGLRNIHIKASGNAGHTGLALIQYNNGPGWIENVTIEGFNTGIDVSDGWGETFTLKNIALINQNDGGFGVKVADKLLAIEALISEQKYQNVTPILLHDTDDFNSEFGGAPHLTIVNSSFKSKLKSNKPVIQINVGHCFVRNLKARGYNEALINDHGVERKFEKSTIKSEYISVHGKTASEAKNVVLTYLNAPAKSINLPLPFTPEINTKVWDKLASGNYTQVSQNDLKDGKLNVKTDWVIVDPSKYNDDTQLLQASLNCGAKYVGLLNNETFLISKNIVVNANKGKVELIYGHMIDLMADKNLRQRQNIDQPNDKTLITFETGSAKKVTIKGIRFITDDWNNSDMLLFQNNSAQTLIFEDLRCKQIPRAYRNGKASYGKQVFFENVEFAYTGAFYDVLMRFDNQKVVARQFNLEAPILIDPITIEGKKYNRFTALPKLCNNGSQIIVLSQKLGEINGVFVETTNGGKTELLSTYFNSARSIYNTEAKDLTNFIVSGNNSDFCLVGQERIRTDMVDEIAKLRLPNKNNYGIYISEGKQYIIEATSLPTYLNYTGVNPFNDTSYDTNDKKNHFRMTGLLRILTK